MFSMASEKSLAQASVSPLESKKRDNAKNKTIMALLVLPLVLLAVSLISVIGVFYRDNVQASSKYAGLSRAEKLLVKHPLIGR